MREIRSIAIRSAYAHHGDEAGYKQILKYTKPVSVYGIDFRKPSNRFFRSYHFIHEFIARIRSIGKTFEVVHVLYGEEYYRFTRWLFPFKKVVVTFHQPPQILERELSKGDFNGRVAGFLHRITKSRLKKLDAAIVMTEEQKKVAERYIPTEKLHVIPLGVNLEKLNRLFLLKGEPRDRSRFLTVGEWQRDWDLYFRIVDLAKQVYPKFNFVLINRNIQPEILERVQGFSNVHYLSNVTDLEMFELYKTSLALFLPLKSAAGNNALNEALVLGCPVITNCSFEHMFTNAEGVFYNFEIPEEFMLIVERLTKLSDIDLTKVSEVAHAMAQKLGWPAVTDKVINVYRKLIT